VRDEDEKVDETSRSAASGRTVGERSFLVERVEIHRACERSPDVLGEDNDYLSLSMAYALMYLKAGLYQPGPTRLLRRD